LSTGTFFDLGQQYIASQGPSINQFLSLEETRQRQGRQQNAQGNDFFSTHNGFDFVQQPTYFS
jgi:hypothetical protein